MSELIKIALIGDYSQDVTAHVAIPKALEIAASDNDLQLQYDWCPTKTLVNDLKQSLSQYNGIWAVPASPYENMSGALSAIRYARENNIPYLGTCGGYQHAILEFAHNVLRLVDAENAEVNPNSEFPLINPLVCSLVEQTGEVHLADSTKIREIYGMADIKERYHCSYGFNRDYLHLFKKTGLVVSSFDNDGDPRSIELPDHPFFIGTAFQPERAGLDNKNHPLVNEFVLSASNYNASHE